MERKKVMVNEGKIKKRIFVWNIVGVIFVSSLGSFLHFIFDISGEKVWAGIIGAVNESTWEHLKLLFWPIVIWMIPEYIFYGRKISEFFWIKANSILMGMISIIVLYYTTSGIIGENIAILNISIFVIGAAIAGFYSIKKLNKVCVYQGMTVKDVVGIIVIIVLAVLFITFTFYPIRIGLFAGPDGKFGI